LLILNSNFFFFFDSTKSGQRKKSYGSDVTKKIWKMSRESKEIRILLKNPATSMDDVLLVLPSTDQLTVGNVKGRISSVYPGSPEPERQRLIFSGQCLTNDEQPFASVLQGRSLDDAHTFHIVIRPKVQPQPQPQVYARQENNNVNHVNNVQQQQNVPQQQQQQQQQQRHQDDPPQFPRQNQAVVGFGDNMTLLFKLAVLIFVLSQGGGTMRAIMLYVFALFVFLYQTGRLRVLTGHINFRFPGRPDVAANAAAHHVQREQQREQGAPAAGEPAVPAQIDPNHYVQDEAAAMAEARARAELAQHGAQALPPVATLPSGRPRPQGVVQELEAFFKPFFFSMIPSWNEHLPQWAQDLQ
jgi:hypothetical protein